MSSLAHRLKDRYFRDEDHPYRLFEATIQSLLRPEHTLLDAGCGWTAPIWPNSTLTTWLVPDESVDIIMARSVMEHVADPTAVYREMSRVLKPGGYFVFVTANLWDYSALIARVIPNRFHPWIVARTEGRQEHDVFPIQYKTNTRSAVSKYAREAGFKVESFRYLGQYPSYLLFNGLLFFVGTLYEKLISRFEGLGFLRGWIMAVLKKD